jgi:hypothetical protein
MTLCSRPNELPKGHRSVGACRRAANLTDNNTRQSELGRCSIHSACAREAVVLNAEAIIDIDECLQKIRKAIAWVTDKLNASRNSRRIRIPYR